MATLTLSGFQTYELINGDYTSTETHDGYDRFVKDSDENTIVEYKTQYGPYSFSGAYYIIKIFEVEGSVPIEKPLYRNNGTDASVGTWIDMQEIE